MTTKLPTPEWVQVGTEVVVYNYRGFGGIRARQATIERITTTQFRIEGDDRPWWHTKGTSGDGEILRHGPTEYLVLLDSDKGQGVWAQFTRKERIDRLCSAASRVERGHPSLGDVNELRAALAALQDDDIQDS